MSDDSCFYDLEDYSRYVENENEQNWSISDKLYEGSKKNHTFFREFDVRHICTI